MHPRKNPGYAYPQKSVYRPGLVTLWPRICFRQYVGATAFRTHFYFVVVVVVVVVVIIIIITVDVSGVTRVGDTRGSN